MKMNEMIMSARLPRRKNVRGIVINRKGEFLLISKRVYKDDDAWDFPGGGIEGSETPEETILREIEEELGMKNVEIVLKSRHSLEWDWPKRVREMFGNRWSGQEAVMIVLKFLGENWDDLDTNDKEVEKYKWVKEKDLKKCLKFKGQYECTERILEELKGKGLG